MLLTESIFGLMQIRLVIRAVSRIMNATYVTHFMHFYDNFVIAYQMSTAKLGNILGRRKPEGKGGNNLEGTFLMKNCAYRITSRKFWRAAFTMGYNLP